MDSYILGDFSSINLQVSLKLKQLMGTVHKTLLFPFFPFVNFKEKK